MQEFIRIANIWVRDRNYMVHISIHTQTQHIHVFKYNEEKCICEYEVFNNSTEAADYLELLL